MQNPIHPSHRNAYNRVYYQKNKESMKANFRAYHQKNKESINAQGRVYRQKNKESINAQGRVYRQKNKESISAQGRVYYQKNKESINAHKRFTDKIKYTNDLPYKLMILVKNAAGRITGKRPRNKETLELLGCTMEHYIQHLESKFTEGMNWDNHTVEGWHIDHIKPLREKELTLEEKLERLHYTNTQPLWAEDNIAKGNNLEELD